MPAKIMDSGLDGWTPDRLGDLTDRTYFITGGNAGLGFETAKVPPRRRCRCADRLPVVGQGRGGRR